MGSCGSSVADRAIGLDGHDAVKEYVIEKAKKDFAENYIKEIYKSTSANIKRLKQKKLKEIEDYEEDSKKIIQEVKVDIEKRQPGSVGKAQALHKKPAEQLLGLNDTLLKFQNQRHLVNDRYQQEEKEIIHDIREEFEKIYDNINPTTSKLPNINNLSDSDRNKAFKWGEKYAEKEIKINNNQLKEQLDKKFEFSRYEHRFDNIAPAKTLNDILDEGRQRAHKSSMKGSRCATC